MHIADKQISPEDLEILRLLEESLWRAETRYDSAYMNKIFAADFIEFGRSGQIYSRAEMMFEPDPLRTISARLPLLDFNARYLSDEIVQITYVSEVTNAGKVSRGNRSSIWSRTKRGWQLRFHQGTPF